MKQIAMLFAGICIIAPFASASTMCVAGTLASYEALGMSGCTIGTNTVSDFNSPSGITGATPIAPDLVDITPSGGNSTPTLVFTTTAAATNGDLLEALFNYNLSGNLYTSSSITLAGTSSTGNGAVTEIQNDCLGGSFDATGVNNCSTGNTKTLLTLGDGNDSAMFAPVSSIGVTDDFTVDSGGIGAGNGSYGGAITDAFAATSAVPEPASFWLLGAGFACLAFLSLKFRIPGKQGDSSWLA